MKKVILALFGAASLAVGSGAVAMATTDTGHDVQTLAAAESRVLALLHQFKDDATWRSAFNAAAAAQSADLARLKGDLAGHQSNTVIVPNLIGVELDHAEARLLADGLTYTVVGGGIFGVVIPADWTVCSQHPGPGARVARGSSVELDVEKFGCSSTT